MMQSPAKTSSSTSVNFHIPILPLIVHKIIFTIPTNTPFLFTSAISHLLIFAYNHPNKLHQKHFPYLNHFANTDQETRNQKARKSFEDWHCFNLSLLQGIDSESRAENHWFFIAQTLTIGVFQVWQTIQSTFSHALKLLSLLPYPNNTTSKTPIPLESSCLTWYSF